MTATLLVLAVAALGLSAGALFAEGAVLVPFWRALPPESFLAWYRRNGALLLRFFGPLEAVASLLPILAAIAAWLSGSDALRFLLAASLLSLLVLATFPIYFKRANASFAEGTIAPDRLPDELARWARWHWARVAIAIAAFLEGVLAALAHGS